MSHKAMTATVCHGPNDLRGEKWPVPRIGSFLGKYRSHVGVLTPPCVMRSEAPPGAEASAPFLAERR